MFPIWNQKVTEHKVWQISSVGHIPKTFHFSGPPFLEKAYFPKQHNNIRNTDDIYAKIDYYKVKTII